MNLAFLFTRKISLKTWIDTGLFGREKLIYEKMIEDKFCSKVYWFTYGVDDHKYQKKLCTGIKVISMSKVFNSKVGIYIYSILLPFIHFKILSSVQMVKTNQMEGSWTAVLIKLLYGCKFYLRTGYTWSQLLEKSEKGSKLYKLSKIIEKVAYIYCDMASVSSFHNQVYLQANYSFNFKKLFVLGNFIDTQLFSSSKPILKRDQESLLYIGRLNHEKNLKPLIESIANLNLKLDIYGAGDQEKMLKSYTKELDASIIFHGLVANEKLVDIYNSHKYYILCSHAEGMPKTLIEAMSCACICLGTDVEGINELIIDNKNGFLAFGVSTNDISLVIKRALSCKETKEISKEARKLIHNSFSLDAVYQLEKSKIQECLS